MSDALLRVEGLVKHFPVRGTSLRHSRSKVRAVNGVSFDVLERETLALVGESGSGKTTVGKCVTRIQKPTAGRVVFGGEDISAKSFKQLQPIRRDIQFVFQDPYSSLPARSSIADILSEPLRIHKTAGKREQRSRVSRLLSLVGLSDSVAGRYPHELSGGQRQRVGIARALALDPKLLVLDEPVSALDVSVQAQIINLLSSIRRELNVAYLFITHDLAVVRQIADRVAVLHLGSIVEQGRTDAVLDHPAHPYTQALLSAVPVPDPRLRGARDRIVLSGEPPNPIDPPAGCAFHTRCWKARDRCRIERPELRARASTDAASACHFSDNDLAGPPGREPHLPARGAQR